MPPSSASDLAVVPVPRRQRLAVEPEDRRHLGLDDALRPRAVIDDASPQPAALIGDGEESGPVRRTRIADMPPNSLYGEVSSRPPRNSSCPKRWRDGSRGSNAAIGRARTSMRTGASGTLGLSGSARACSAKPTSAAASDDEADPGGLEAHACSLRRTPCRGSGMACSSNSSASFSVMAPPSSSASTMVTARR